MGFVFQKVHGNCKTGVDMDVGSLVYEPPRDGPTLWEIGIPDRTAAEFYVPDPNPKYINKLYVNHPQKYARSTYICSLDYDYANLEFKLQVLQSLYGIIHMIVNHNLAGLGNMDCGKDTQICILILTWFTLLASMTTEKIGFLLKLPGL